MNNSEVGVSRTKRECEHPHASCSQCSRVRVCGCSPTGVFELQLLELYFLRRVVVYRHPPPGKNVLSFRSLVSCPKVVCCVLPKSVVSSFCQRSLLLSARTCVFSATFRLPTPKSPTALRKILEVRSCFNSPGVSALPRLQNQILQIGARHVWIARGVDCLPRACLWHSGEQSGGSCKRRLACLTDARWAGEASQVLSKKRPSSVEKSALHHTLTRTNMCWSFTSGVRESNLFCVIHIRPTSRRRGI